VDAGAAHALQHGGSLLPVGVVTLSGTFDRGDVVRVADPSGREIARGLTNYPSTDLTRICGQQSQELERILGYVYAEEVIHRNNMVLL
jgi:glutamate 5-kinase